MKGGEPKRKLVKLRAGVFLLAIMLSFALGANFFSA
jgi:hypothetical protein